MSRRGISKVPTKEQKQVLTELHRISSKLKAKRLELGITQEYLAELMDVSTETIRFIEQDRRIPSLPMLIRICKVLKIDVLN